MRGARRRGRPWNARPPRRVDSPCVPGAPPRNARPPRPPERSRGPRSQRDSTSSSLKPLKRKETSKRTSKLTLLYFTLLYFTLLYLLTYLLTCLLTHLHDLRFECKANDISEDFGKRRRRGLPVVRPVARGRQQPSSLEAKAILVLHLALVSVGTLKWTLNIIISLKTNHLNIKISHIYNNKHTYNNNHNRYMYNRVYKEIVLQR